MGILLKWGAFLSVYCVSWAARWPAARGKEGSCPLATTIEPPRNPKTPEEWQNAVDAADALLKIDSARTYGLVTGGPEVGAGRCRELIHKAEELHDIEPREDAVERFLSRLPHGPGS